MPKKTKRAELNLSKEEYKMLESISNSRRKPKREIDRAKILLLYTKKFDEATIIRTVSTKEY